MPLTGPSRRMPCLSPGQVYRMHRWIILHQSDPVVMCWLQTHRPRSNWTGSSLQWAWLEMPRGCFRRLLERFGW